MRKTEMIQTEYQETVERMIRTERIDKTNAVFEKTEGGFLKLTFQGQEYPRIKVLRLFPFTDPDRYLSVRDPKNKDREIGLIEKITDLDEATAEEIRRQLNLYYFTPVITKVINIKSEYGYAYFHVITDRGECRFTINMGANAVVRLSDRRLIITDLDDNRFEIRDVLALSQKEQRKLDLFL